MKLSNPSTLEFSQWVPAPIDKVFHFFCDENNLETLTPEWLKFRVEGKSTPTLQAGTLINYRLRIRGVPVRWQSRIEAWEPNRSFIDFQTKGPYRLWHHTHSFEVEGNGTRMKDKILYEVPGGWVGSMLLGRFVESDIRRIFHFRQNKIQEVFSESWP